MSGKAAKRAARLEQQLTAMEAELGVSREEVVEQQAALEAQYSSLSLLQREIETWGWIDLNSSGNDVGSADIVSLARRVETMRLLRRLRHENPIAKEAIKMALRFILGRGVSYTIEDEQTRSIVDAFWFNPKNQAVLTSLEALKARLDNELTDGEEFIAAATGLGEPYIELSTIPVEEIPTESGILYDPDNREIVVAYKRRYRPQEWDPQTETWKPAKDIITRYYLDWRVEEEDLPDIAARGLPIPDSKIARDGNDNYIRVFHHKINPARGKGGIRGISELFASREWIKVFKTFMEERAVMNALANALSMQRKVKGGPNALSKVSGKIGGTQTIPSDNPLGIEDLLRMRRPRAGGILDTTDNVDWKGIRADTGALHAHTDAQMILSTAGAGLSTAGNYFGGSSGSLAASQLLELPMVKNYEDGQERVKNELTDIVAFVVSTAQGKLVLPNELKIAWEFPPIITQDVVKWMAALVQLTGQVAPKNAVIKREAVKMSLAVLNIPNRETLMIEFDKEEEKILAQAQLLQQQQLDAQMAAAKNGMPMGGPGAPPGAKPVGSGPGVPVAGKGPGSGQGPNGASLTSNPDQQRLAAGKAPKEAPTGPRTRRQ